MPVEQPTGCYVEIFLEEEKLAYITFIYDIRSINFRFDTGTIRLRFNSGLDGQTLMHKTAKLQRGVNLRSDTETVGLWVDFRVDKRKY